MWLTGPAGPSPPPVPRRRLWTSQSAPQRPFPLLLLSGMWPEAEPQVLMLLSCSLPECP